MGPVCRESPSVPIGICRVFQIDFWQKWNAFFPSAALVEFFSVPTPGARVIPRFEQRKRLMKSREINLLRWKGSHFMKTQRKLNYFFEFSTGAPLPRGSGFQQRKRDSKSVVCKVQNRKLWFFGLRAPRLYRRRHARRPCFAGGVDFIEMRNHKENEPTFRDLRKTSTRKALNASI